MTDFEKLKQAIKDSGMTITTIAKRAGIDRATFYNRMNAKGEFRASEIDGISQTLRLSKKQRDDIFFARKK